TLLGKHAPGGFVLRGVRLHSANGVLFVAHMRAIRGRASLSRNSLQSISLFCHCAALRLRPMAMSNFLSWVTCMGWPPLQHECVVIPCACKYPLAFASKIGYTMGVREKGGGSIWQIPLPFTRALMRSSSKMPRQFWQS